MGGRDTTNGLRPYHDDQSHIEKGALPDPEEDGPSCAPLRDGDVEGLQGVAQIGQQGVDRASHECERDDRQDCDECKDECVLDQTLSGLSSSGWVIPHG